MKKLITILLVFISFGVSAQSWTNFNAFGLQRKIVSGDTTWRFAGSGSNGFKVFNPNGGGGSADSSVFRTNNNSYSLAGMQTKLNGYVPITRLVSTSNGILGGGNLGFNLSLSSDTTYNRTVANSMGLSALQTKFNLYQKAITLTTTGTSGAAILVNDTLNIPQYTGGGGTIGYAFGDYVGRDGSAGISFDAGLNGRIYSNGNLDLILSANESITAATGGMLLKVRNGDALAIDVNKNVSIPILATGLTPPTTSGTTMMVVSDANGRLSMKTEPSGSVPDTTVYRTVANSFTKAQAQPRITLTTTGSGAATFNAGTGALNIPTVSTSTFVPYTGATANVDLGLFALSANDVNADYVFGINTSTSSFYKAINTFTSSTVSPGGQNGTVLINATSNPVSVELPLASASTQDGKGQIITVKKIDSSINNVTVTVTGGGNLDGGSITTYNMVTQNHSVTFQSDGTQWWIISRYN